MRQRLLINHERPDRMIYELSQELWWLLVEVIKADPEKDVPYEAIYLSKDKKSHIHVIQDPLVHMEYLVVQGENAQAEIESIKKYANVLSRSEALQMMDDAVTPADKKIALACLAVMATESFDAEVFERQRRGFQDADPEVRKVAAWVTVYPAWPELLPLLRAMRDGDAAAELRGCGAPPQRLRGARDRAEREAGGDTDSIPEDPARKAMTQVRFDLVLRPGTPSKDVIPNVETACRAINKTLQVAFVYVGQEHPGEGVTAEVWEDRYAGKIKLVDDTKMPAVYVAPFLEMRFGHDFVYFTLADNLPHVKPSELRNMAERGEPNRATALQRLGLGETEDHDAQTARILIDGIRSRDVEERRAATLSMFLLKWGTFGPALDAAIVAETDEPLKAQQIVSRRYLESSLVI